MPDDTRVRAERSVVVARPDWEVFTFVADAENDVLWRLRAVYVRKTYQGPMGLGATYWYVSHRLCGRRTGILRVVAYETDRHVAYEGSFDGGLQPHDSYRFEPVDGGTRITATYAPPLSGLSRLFSAYAFMRLRRELAEDLGRLKRLLEDPARGTALVDAIQR